MHPLSRAFAVLWFAAFCGCNELPEPEVRETPEGVVVEVKRLGEYPSAVKRLRLIRAGYGEPVFEIAGARDDTFEIWEIRLDRGWNDMTPWRQRHSVLYPSSGRFWLQPGERYRLEIWGSPEWKHRRVEFVMPDLAPQQELDGPLPAYWSGRAMGPAASRNHFAWRACGECDGGALHPRCTPTASPDGDADALLRFLSR